MTDPIKIDDIFPFPPEGYELEPEGTFETTNGAAISYTIHPGDVQLDINLCNWFRPTDLKELRKFLKVLIKALPK